MAVSLNSVIGFNSTLQAKCQHLRTGVGASILKVTHFSPSWMVGLRRPIKDRKRGPCLLVANGDQVATGTSDKGSENAERSFSDNQSSAVNLPSLGSPTRESQFETNAEAELGSQTPKVSNGSIVSSDLKEDTSSTDIKSTPKRSRLTAREKLRAARVLSRSTEPKASKSKGELGSRVLEILRESDRGKKRSGLPEAPTNLFDDSKRGMPKSGLTFELPGGVDVFLIIFSVVFISTVMFTTTFIVWKVGAIHFNEY